ETTRGQLLRSYAEIGRGDRILPEAGVEAAEIGDDDWERLFVLREGRGGGGKEHGEQRADARGGSHGGKRTTRQAGRRQARSKRRPAGVRHGAGHHVPAKTHTSKGLSAVPRHQCFSGVSTKMPK